MYSNLKLKERVPPHFFSSTLLKALLRAETHVPSERRDAREKAFVHTFTRARDFIREESRAARRVTRGINTLTLSWITRGKTKSFDFRGTFLNFEATKDATRKDEQREGDERNEGR